jgi:hypothetical protein
MGAKLRDLTGETFGKLTVLHQVAKRLYGKTTKRMWACKCECGNTLDVNTGALTTGNTKSCGCFHNSLSAKNSKNSRYKLAKPDAGYVSVMNSYKQNAVSRNQTFELTFDQFKSLITSNCFYCGNEPSNVYKRAYYDIKYNGVDRVDNNIGYTLSNTVTCCKICNIAKNNNTYDDFLQWANRLVKYKLTKLVKNHPNNDALGEAVRKLIR